MKYNLPSGVVIEGTPAQVIEVASKLGYSVDLYPAHLFYKSSSRGPLLITDMESNHICAAMLKMYREWAANLSTLSPTEVINAMQSGPTGQTFTALFTEYATRVARKLV